MSEVKMLKRVYQNLLHELDCQFFQVGYKRGDCDCVRRDFRKYIMKVKARKS
jgi:hypothetical protein